MDYKADIGVFGGSGFYSLIDNVEEVEIDTPYGKPSDKISIATISGKKVAFLPRHGKDHKLPPHLINYRANMYAMKMLGVTKVISPCSCGSLKANLKPGDFVISDQFVDRTKDRKDTFFEGPEVKHIGAANPYDEDLRQLAIETAKELDITAHERGTIVVINGPRFSTKAESRWFSNMGWDTINMTQYPESYLALELEIKLVNIALVTDYDAGLEGRDDIEPVTMEAVLKTFNENIDKVKNLINSMIDKM